MAVASLEPDGWPAVPAHRSALLSVPLYGQCMVPFEVARSSVALIQWPSPLTSVLPVGLEPAPAALVESILYHFYHLFVQVCGQLHGMELGLAVPHLASRNRTFLSHPPCRHGSILFLGTTGRRLPLMRSAASGFCSGSFGALSPSCHRVFSTPASIQTSFPFLLHHRSVLPRVPLCTEWCPNAAVAVSVC